MKKLQLILVFWLIFNSFAYAGNDYFKTTAKFEYDVNALYERVCNILEIKPQYGCEIVVRDCYTSYYSTDLNQIAISSKQNTKYVMAHEMVHLCLSSIKSEKIQELVAKYVEYELRKE
jgi:hypothetical protein